MELIECMKCSVLLALVLAVCSAVAEKEIVSEMEASDAHLAVKRSAGQSDFWKRDTERSTNSFWKRDLEDGAQMAEENDDEKRRAQFLGKRRAQFLGKRRQQFLGKREDGEEAVDDESLDEYMNELEKRARQAFLGKRARQAFLGKRARQAFLGKRARQAFLGKRDSMAENASPAEVESYLEEIYSNLVTPNTGMSTGSDVDKRARQAFLGKRARQAFLGKRSDYEMDDSPTEWKRYYLGKRPRIAFLGKRAVDIDEDKRARQAFLGKRSTDEHAESTE